MAKIAKKPGAKSTKPKQAKRHKAARRTANPAKRPGGKPNRRTKASRRKR